MEFTVYRAQLHGVYCKVTYPSTAYNEFAYNEFRMTNNSSRFIGQNPNFATKSRSMSLAHESEILKSYLLCYPISVLEQLKCLLEPEFSIYTQAEIQTHKCRFYKKNCRDDRQPQWGL